MEVRKIWGVILAALALSGCVRDEGPLGPGTGLGEVGGVQASLSCRADVRDGTLSCTTPQLSSGAASGALIGGQGRYVLLESTDVRYEVSDSIGAVFSASVAVRNFLTQPLGTVDGVDSDTAGVRVFFINDPQVTAGSGSVSVRNADGTGEFTSAGQPYFQYRTHLAPGQSTGDKRWQWDLSETVEAFSFVVGVSASVPAEGDVVPGTRLDASTLSVGHEFACALDLAGQAYCWGSNSNGQLGVGVVGDRGTPTPVAGGLTFATISAGVTHACGLTTAGVAYCWGAGASNRLGNGSTGDQLAPVAVSTTVEFTSISAADAHTCAVAVGGDAYCWGSGGNGKVGLGSATGSATPVLVVGGLKYRSVSAGYFHTCAITTDDTAVCWGNGNSGRSGDGNTGAHNLLMPTAIQSTAKFARISAGSAYTCALTTAGAAYCFGANGSGQLGNGANTGTGTPTAVLGGHEFTTIDVRFAHTCATKADGAAYCWGNNEYGRLGTGDTITRGQPVRVESDAKFAFVGVGRYHTCGITTAGAVYCWGRGDNAAQLGNGLATDRYTPVPVSTTRTTAVELVPVAGNGASLVFGEASELGVRVESAGMPVAGVVVRFTTLSGAGTLADTLVTSGADGIATALWLPGTTAGEQRLRASVAGVEVEFTTTVAAPVAGRAYFGRNEYVEYIPGELPIILSSPHAGLTTPAEIPDRTYGTTVRDGEIHDLALRTAEALQELTGRRPHVVMMHLRRTKLDANREIVEAAQGNIFAERAWHEYHGWIETASDLARNAHSRGFYIDLHGHGHTVQRLELGYLLTATDLARTDAQLNQAQYVNKSSIRTLASTAPGGLVELIRGETSFGEILVRHGYPSVPSKSDPHPAGAPYFNGGYSTVRHGSRSGGAIDGVQIEHNSQGVRDSAAARAAYSRALAESILEYLETHMGLQLRQPQR